MTLGGLSPEAKLLLHYHNILDHMGFGALRDLAKEGYLPRKIADAENVVCAACHIGKGHKRAAEKDHSIISGNIKEPGDVVHMDQVEFTTPGRPMIASG